MQHLKQAMIKPLLALLVIASFPAYAAETFRTPAKLYGDAYSIKMVLIRGEFEYDLPMWVKPDQKQSSLDKDQILELGWNFKDFRDTDAFLAGQEIKLPNFINLKSEWAYIPEFPKRCCYGIIGQDILKNYEVRFDPNPPAHLEWTPISKADSKVTLPKNLSALFSLKTAQHSRTPFRLNLSEGTLAFEDEKPLPSGLKASRKEPLFRFEFKPPARDLIIQSLSPSLSKKTKYGLKPGLKVLALNGVAVARLDRFEVNDYLTGKKTKTVEIKWENSNVSFDFEKDEFIEPKPLPSPAGRN